MLVPQFVLEVTPIIPLLKTDFVTIFDDLVYPTSNHLDNNLFHKLLLILL